MSRPEFFRWHDELAVRIADIVLVHRDDAEDKTFLVLLRGETDNLRLRLSDEAGRKLLEIL